MLKALDKIEHFRVIELIQMQEGFSDFWAAIFDEFKERRVITENSGRFYINKPYITLLRAEYESKLSSIEQEENERQIRIQHMRADIKQINQAKVISWLSIFIAVAGLIVSILSVTIWK